MLSASLGRVSAILAATDWHRRGTPNAKTLGLGFGSWPLRHALTHKLRDVSGSTTSRTDESPSVYAR